MHKSIGIVVVAGITLFSSHLLAQNISPKPDCNIKGNISWNNNEKLYHLPGMKDYKITKISADKGERWFCTESTAIANGWKKAPR
jgi:hypothetical protein